jgi:PST family polysaccharide transporter
MSDIKKNIALLLLVQISNYAFPLISLPYLMRTLGAQEFGMIAISQAIIQYCIIFSDYGFNLSATRRLAISDTSNEFNKIFFSTFIAKLILVIFCGMVLFFVFPFIHGTQYNSAATAILFLSVIGNLLFPLYLFQALESMAKIVWITIIAKFLSLMSVFFLVNNKDDILGAALSLSLGLVVSGLISVIYIFKKKIISYTAISFNDIKESFADGFPLFVSNLAISFYTTFNVLLAGHQFSIETVGNFSAAERLRMAVQSLFAPVQQVIFPRVNKIYNKERSLKSAMLKFGCVFILFGATLTFLMVLFGKVLSALYFGEKYCIAPELFMKMSPLFVIISLSIVLGQWGLVVLGRSKNLSKIYIVGALCHLLYIFPFIKYFSISGLVYSVILTELLICSMMAFCLFFALKKK